MKGTYLDGLVGLPGVGPKTAERLAARGLKSRADLVALVPRRWDDLRVVTPVASLVPGVMQTSRLEVKSARVVFSRKRFLEVVFTDEEGGRLVGLWFYFNAGMRARFAPGARFLVSGVPRPYKGALQVAHPETLRLGEGGEGSAGVRVRYPEVEGVPSHLVAKLCRGLAERHAAEIPDGLPLAVRARHGFPSAGEALLRLHQVPDDAPPERVAALNAGRDPAQRRLAFDELFFLQLGLARRRAQTRREVAPPCPADAGGRRALARFLGALGFLPTGAQRRAIEEIAADLAKPHPMNRLLQGDVGSGKTVVMYAAAEIAMAAGRQVAVMAPTEILAEQHARTLSRWAEEGGRRLALLTASSPRAAQKEALAGLAEGSVDVVVGTHALLSERVRFARLGLAIVDEQHRFGVGQRATLREKGAGVSPHLLVMTATPIPRTLALTLYGDLDVTVLDEMPPGRRPPETVLLSGARGRKKAVDAVAHVLSAGRQGYVVCPRVDASDQDGDSDTKSVIATRERLGRELAGVEIGLVHGRLPAAEREVVMARFRAGEVRLLVATTVIEVGVDVPQADVMLIEGAERFGLSQLHQLRGRVGRGGSPSLCILLAEADAMSDPASDTARRLEVMTRSTDGFEIAEADLALRGPGEIYGTRQAGLPRLRFADLTRDIDLLRAARRDAFELLDADPTLARPEHEMTRHVLDERWAQGALFAEEAG